MTIGGEAQSARSPRTGIVGKYRDEQRRAVEVWKSAEAATRFYSSDLFQQMVRSTGIPAPTITSYPVETVRM